MEGKKKEGKCITVFYSDGSSVSRKDGILVSENDIFITIKTDDKTIRLPINRIIRVEEK